MMRIALLPALALIAACSPQEEAAPEPAASTAAASATPTEAAPEPTPSAVPGRAWRYTSLEKCKLAYEERGEMPYTEVLCTGPGGWAVRITDSDLRQALSIVSPGGKQSKLDLNDVSGGAFSSFGTTAEWRGPSAEPFAPDSLIVRFKVAEQPHPAPEVAYLLAIRLVPTPCLVAKVAPGPGQNDAARTAADGSKAC